MILDKKINGVNLVINIDIKNDKDKILLCKDCGKLVDVRYQKLLG